MSDCPKCEDSTWIVVERNGVTGAERCECFDARRNSAREARAEIPENYAASTFESFRLPDDNPIAKGQLGSAVVVAKTYARTFPAIDKPGLLLVGPPGVGKTHLAVAALKILVSRGFDGVFFDYQTLLERVQAGWNAASGTADREAYRTALDTDLLLLDDLGARRASEWVEDTITAIITHRCNHRKALLATTNLPDAAFGDTLIASVVKAPGEPQQRRYVRSLSDVIGERSVSRLFEMCRVVNVRVGHDYRVESNRAGLFAGIRLG